MRDIRQTRFLCSWRLRNWLVFPVILWLFLARHFPCQPCWLSSRSFSGGFSCITDRRVSPTLAHAAPMARVVLTSGGSESSRSRKEPVKSKMLATPYRKGCNPRRRTDQPRLEVFLSRGIRSITCTTSLPDNHSTRLCNTLDVRWNLLVAGRLRLALLLFSFVASCQTPHQWAER